MGVVNYCVGFFVLHIGVGLDVFQRLSLKKMMCLFLHIIFSGVIMEQ